MYMNIE